MNETPITEIARVKDMQMVEVVWYDATGVNGWRKKNLRPDLVKCHNVGYLVERTGHHITLAHGRTKEMHDGLTVIPMSCVKEIWVVGRIRPNGEPMEPWRADLKAWDESPAKYLAPQQSEPQT